jgi:hypothetical protein
LVMDAAGNFTVQAHQVARTTTASFTNSLLSRTALGRRR